MVCVLSDRAIEVFVRTESNAKRHSGGVSISTLQPVRPRDKPKASSHYPASLLKCIIRPVFVVIPTAFESGI